VLSIRGVPIPNLGFVTLWTDITEQRRYEQLIESQNAELETARPHRRARSRQDPPRQRGRPARPQRGAPAPDHTIPAMIAYVDAGQRYRFANKGYADWFGLDQQRIVGKSILEVVGPEAYAQVQPHLEQALPASR
jgi:PAS domain-containing protein